MSTALSFLIPILFLAVFILCLFKKVRVYDSFVKGAKQSVPLVMDLFPYLVCIFILTEVFEQSGLSTLFCNFLSPAFSFFGIPKELTKLIIIKPFSGSGATALLSEILKNNPPDGYISRCACVCYGSSETVFYIGAVYFSNLKNKKFFSAIIISLFCSFIGTVFACFLCRII